MIKTITSRENKIIKLTASLLKHNGRCKNGLFIAEGKRLCEEVVKWNPQNTKFFIVSDSFDEKNPDYTKGFDAYKIPDSLFHSICGTETPQGILAVINIPSGTDIPLKSNNVLILDGVSEPGNMGTILRTAEAMGFYDIFITKGSADIYSPKVVRSTMGAIFRLSFHFENDIGFISDLKNNGFEIISTALCNSVPLNKMHNKSKCAVVIGNEANGVSKEILDISDIIVKIPMPGNAESLNASVAAGIVMYELSKKEK